MVELVDTVEMVDMDLEDDCLLSERRLSADCEDILLFFPASCSLTTCLA